MANRLGGKGSVLSGFSSNPISYETGEASVLRKTIVGVKAAKALSPTPDQKKPIPAVARPGGAGKRTF